MRMNPPRGPASNFMPPSNAPQPTATQSSVQQPRAQGRTFVLTHREAMASNAVVEGMIFISGYIAHALFDPGATHSFISNAFAYKLNQVSEPLEFQLVVSTPVGVKIIGSTKYVNCEVVIGEMETSIDLTKLGEIEFEAILGMDWLSACGAHVDCNRKKIIFKMEEFRSLFLKG